MKVRVNSGDTDVYERLQSVLDENEDEWKFTTEQIKWHKNCYSSFTSTTNLSRLTETKKDETEQERQEKQERVQREDFR